MRATRQESSSREGYGFLEILMTLTLKVRGTERVQDG